MAEPLRYVFDTIELVCFSERQWVAKTLGALDALFEKDGIAIDGYRSDASLYLVVGWANTRIMQGSGLFFLVVEPEDHSIPIALPSQAKYQRSFFSMVYLFASSRMIASTLFLNVIRSRYCGEFSSKDTASSFCVECLQMINTDGVADASSGMHQASLCRAVAMLQRLITDGGRVTFVAITRKNAEFPVLHVIGNRLRLATRHVFVDDKWTFLLRIARANKQVCCDGLGVLFQHGKFGFVRADIFGLLGKGFD